MNTEINLTSLEKIRQDINSGKKLDNYGYRVYTEKCDCGELDCPGYVTTTILSKDFEKPEKTEIPDPQIPQFDACFIYKNGEWDRIETD
jgi:hypothetical protein